VSVLVDAVLTTWHSLTTYHVKGRDRVGLGTFLLSGAPVDSMIMSVEDVIVCHKVTRYVRYDVNSFHLELSGRESQKGPLLVQRPKKDIKELELSEREACATQGSICWRSYQRMKSCVAQQGSSKGRTSGQS
jgi:hypothetical protein